MKKTSNSIIWLIIPVILTCSALSIYLYRPLWFDESLTLMNFVVGKSLSQIYHSYIIPNNQIIYTMCLSLWTQMTNAAGMNFDFASRLLSGIFSVASIIVLYSGFKRQTGGAKGMYFLLLSVYCSVPFLLYGTAVRGYQLSFLLLILLTWSVKNIACKITWQNLSAYAVLSLLAVGTIPTNLLGIGMAVGLFMPELWGKWKRIAVLATIPFVISGAFYFPIWNKFIQVCNLNEGLTDRLSAIIVPYIAFLLNYSIIIILGIWGWILACKKRKIRYLNLLRLAAAILWAIPCMILKVAPFYRVFYPCFAVLLIMTGMGLKHWFYLFYLRLQRNSQKSVLFIISILIIGNFFLLKNNNNAQKIQKFLNLTPMTDDYFQPYYFNDEFFPPSVIRKINSEYINHVNLVFLTFEADSRALYFYATFGGRDNRKYILDGPQFKVNFLPFRSLIVLPRNGDIQKYIRRFNLHNRRVNKLFIDGWHEVWEVL